MRLQYPSFTYFRRIGPAELGAAEFGDLNF